MTDFGRRVAALAAVAIGLSGCTGSTPAATTTDTSSSGQTVTTSATAVTQTADVALTTTEYALVGTWEAAALEDPDRGLLIDQVGDVCTLRADLTLVCTIEGEEVTGFWQASTGVLDNDGEVLLNPMFAWRFDLPGSHGGRHSVVIEDDALIIGGINSTFFQLVERLPRPEPFDGWIDENTERLIGTWTLVSMDENPRVFDKIAAPGDSCTFTVDNRFHCTASSGKWYTMRAWPDAEPGQGAPLSISSDNGVGAGSTYRFDGDQLLISMDGTVWDRVDE